MFISEALIILATTGDPSALQSELGGVVVEDLPMSSAVLTGGERYAPPALVVNGTVYRMVHPDKTTDNMVIQTGNLIVRLDVGHSEKDNVVRAVAAAKVKKLENVNGNWGNQKTILSDEFLSLALEGTPERLQKVIGGKIKNNLSTNNTVLRNGEKYVSSALAVNGTVYRMIYPTYTMDNFIISTNGLVIRLDAGNSEKDNVLRVVSASSVDGVMVYKSRGETFFGRLKSKLGF